MLCIEKNDHLLAFVSFLDLNYCEKCYRARYHNIHHSISSLPLEHRASLNVSILLCRQPRFSLNSKSYLRSEPLILSFSTTSLDVLFSYSLRIPVQGLLFLLCLLAFSRCVQSISLYFLPCICNERGF